MRLIYPAVSERLRRWDVHDALLVLNNSEASLLFSYRNEWYDAAS